jgi:hypothetical protein
MDILQINAQLLSVKRDHMNHTIKYRKIVKKIIASVQIPEVLYKFILNYVGLSPFPMNLHYGPKNIERLRLKTLEEKKPQEQ